MTKQILKAQHEIRPEWQGWILCNLDDEQIGWISNSFLKIDGERVTLKTDYNSMELIVQIGDKIEVIKEDNGWAWVRSSSGGEGVDEKGALSVDIEREIDHELAKLNIVKWVRFRGSKFEELELQGEQVGALKMFTPASESLLKQILNSKRRLLITLNDPDEAPEISIPNFSSDDRLRLYTSEDADRKSINHAATVIDYLADNNGRIRHLVIKQAWGKGKSLFLADPDYVLRHANIDQLVLRAEKQKTRWLSPSGQTVTYPTN